MEGYGAACSRSVITSPSSATNYDESARYHDGFSLIKLYTYGKVGEIRDISVPWEAMATCHRAGVIWLNL